ncbi:unnamed protein product [Dicrocoelium dendriticum]|nr:unnamed protein product [Dicrocoelium dendriticum]
MESDVASYSRRSLQPSNSLNVNVNRPLDTVSRNVTSHGPVYLLPPELLLAIFELLPPVDLLRHVPLVCRLWHDLSLSATLRTRLCLRKDTPPNVLFQSVESRPLLRVLRCPALCRAQCLLPEALQLCQSLQCLDLGFCDLSEETVDRLGQNLPPTLKHLNVEGAKAIGLPFIVHLTSCCPRLEALNLSHCINTCDACIQVISEKLTLLRRLNLNGALWLSDSTLVSLSHAVALRAGHLTDIWLDGFEMTSSGVGDFFDRIGQLEQQIVRFSPSSGCALAPTVPFRGIELLWLSFCDHLSDVAVIQLTKLSTLVSLTLRKAQQITAECWIHLFLPPLCLRPPMSPPPLHRLEHLDLSEASFLNDDVVASICKCCGPQLRSLTLDWCWEVSDIGFSDIVLHCSSLRHLSLVGDHRIEGAPLSDIPTKQPFLTILNLTQCNLIQDFTLEKLVAQLPQLCLFDYFGERVGNQTNDVCHYDLRRSLERVPICHD